MTGLTVAENLAAVPSLADLEPFQAALAREQELQLQASASSAAAAAAAKTTNTTTTRVLCGVREPIAPAGQHITVVKGSLAPESAVVKLSGKSVTRFEGTAVRAAALGGRGARRGAWWVGGLAALGGSGGVFPVAPRESHDSALPAL